MNINEITIDDLMNNDAKTYENIVLNSYITISREEILVLK